jgi:hypothetical protein
VTGPALLAAALALALAGSVGRAGAQEYSPSGAGQGQRVGADSVVSADALAASDETESSTTFDLAGVWQVARHVQLAARPVIYRDRQGEWDVDVYQLAVRVDRPGRVRLRWEAGYLPSPVGILALETRADQNPLIVPATSYTATLPPFEAGTPAVQLASSLYPLAAQASASGAHFDGRVAVLGSSPVRVRPLTGEDKPPASPQLALGGGITPYIGLRLGASFVHGRYATANEVADPSRGDRMATILGLDADYSFGYTRLYADWQRNTYERASDNAVATALTVTAVRTLSPRWFTAARVERQTTSSMLETAAPTDWPGDAPSAVGDGYGSYGGHTYYATRPKASAEWLDAGAASVEAVVGYRLTPEITFRAGYLGYRAFGDDEIEHHAVVSIVWARRWR